MLPLSVFSFYWSKVIYRVDTYFTKALQPFIVINEFFARKIINLIFSKCFLRELLEPPMTYNTTSNFLKKYPYDSQSQQMDIRQSWFLLQNSFESYAEHLAKLNQCT